MWAEFGVQLAEERDEVNIECKQPVPELDDVEPALPALDLAHQRLIATQAVSQIGLAHALAESRELKLLQEDLVVAGV